jgi:hypothetical protein
VCEAYSVGDAIQDCGTLTTTLSFYPSLPNICATLKGTKNNAGPHKDVFQENLHG